MPTWSLGETATWSRDETVAVALLLEGLWELLGHVGGGVTLNQLRDRISDQRERLLREAGILDDQDED